MSTYQHLLAEYPFHASEHILSISMLNKRGHRPRDCTHRTGGAVSRLRQKIGSAQNNLFSLIRLLHQLFAARALMSAVTPSSLLMIDLNRSALSAAIKIEGGGIMSRGYPGGGY